MKIEVFLMLTIVGIVFAIIGLIMHKFPPKKINWFYGYRTNSSMKSQERWDFAQIYSAKLLALIGCCLTAISFLKMFWEVSQKTEMLFGFILTIGAVVLLLIKTELAIKKKFG